ncbi:MAG: hypothetical protein IJ608_14305 [Lachnospiraceae bacterium]|nr:hypothetical protein [Lachnospiraceae bacterium]
MNLSRFEQKTIVNYNSGDQTATVYTRDKTVMRRLDALVIEYPEHYRLMDETDIDKTYEMPKSLINYRKPMSVSDKQRRAASEVMKQLNNAIEKT